MVDAVTGNTELVATKMDLIAARVQRELAFQAKLVPTIMDVSEFAEPGLKTIEFPKLSSFSVTKRVEGAAGDATTLTATTDTLALDQNAYIAWIIDATSKIQSRISSQVEFAGRAAAAHGRQVDLDIIAALEAGAGSDLANGGADITKADVLAMLEFVEGNDANMDDVIFVVSNSQKYALLDIDEFSRNDVFGSPVIRTGIIGQVYGVPVLMHNGMASGRAMVYEKSSCAIGFQKAPTFDEQKANEFGAGAMRSVLDQLYGIEVMQQEAKGVAAGTSPLIAKLN